MFPWGDAPEPTTEAPTYAVGTIVYSGDCRGAVTSVDASAGTISVVWNETAEYGAITYPSDATYLRKAMPWE